MCACAHVCAWVHVCVCLVCAYMCTCMYMLVCVCVCVCMFIFVPYACNVVFLCLYAPVCMHITTTYCCSQPSKSPEHASSVLVQLMAILRNLSDSGSSRDKLLTTDSLLDHLCSVLLYHCCDPDVAFNLCRLLRYVCTTYILWMC